jgi:regulatory protein
VARERDEPGRRRPPPPDDPEQAGPPGDVESVARAICLRALTQRARTRAELAIALRKRGVPDDTAEAVLDRFVEVGLIDDAALAESYALAQHRDRGLARRAVVGKLRRRGVDRNTIDKAVEGIDAASEEAGARTVVVRKLPSVRHLDPAVQARRLYGVLARRGYPASIAASVVAAATAVRPTLDDAETEPAIGEAAPGEG